MAESIDIVVTKSGAEEAAAAIAAIGDAGEKSAQGIDATNASLNFIKDTSANTTSAISQMNAAAGQSETVFRAAEAAAARLNITVEEYNQRTANFIAGTNQMNASLNETTAATEKHTEAKEKSAEASGALSEATNVLTKALAALGLVFTAERIIEITEQYQKTQIQLNSVSASTKELAANTKELYDISQLTGSSYAANVSSFQKLAIETGSLGIAQKDLLQTIRNVNAVVQESGGTAAEAAQAVNLFGRALATGEVQGRQMRTILLQFPQLGQLVASGLNTSTQSLVSLSTKAATSSKDFVKAFNEAADTAKVASKEIELTLGGAITTLGNAILQYIGQTESANGITQLLSTTIAGVARNFSTVAASIEVAITLWGSYYLILVAIPGVFNLIISSVRALTLAIAANPLGFLLVALTAIIALVYEFGNSVKLTASGNITLLGAVIGIWNVFKNVLSGVWTFLVTTLGPTFSAIGSIIQLVFKTGIDIVSGFLNALSLLFPSLGPVADALSALSNPLVSFKAIMADAMIDATTKLNTTKEAATGLGSALGDGSGGSGPGLTKAMGHVTGAAGAMSTALAYAKSNLSDVADKTTLTAAAMEKLELTTRNAFGQMIVAADEWARRSGEDFNKVAANAKTAAATIAQVAAQTTAATHGPATPNSSRTIDSGGQSTNPMLEGGVSTDGGQTFHSPAEDLKFFEQYGRPISNPTSKIAWDTLMTETSDAAILAQITAAAHARHIPGYATGGAFMVGGSGIPDSQLVQFMATPGERVTIQTPEQQRNSDAGARPLSGNPVIIHMNVVTPDADSFRRSKNQIYLELKSRLDGVGRF